MTNLSDLEFVEKVLSKYNVEEGILGAEGLDGYLMVVAISPKLITPSQWIPGIFNDRDFEWESENELNRFQEICIDMYHNHVAFRNGTSEFNPLFDHFDIEGEEQTIVVPWCAGFIFALNHFNILTDSVAEEVSEQVDKIVYPVHIESVQDSPELIVQFEKELKLKGEELLDALFVETLNQDETIAGAIYSLRDYWLENQETNTEASSSGVLTDPEDIPNNLPGRNDPCFCGSGKQFKKCCLN
jgi:uncharacterized protein